jgi:hypothetical protein
LASVGPANHEAAIRQRGDRRRELLAGSGGIDDLFKADFDAGSGKCPDRDIAIRPGLLPDDGKIA